MPESTFKEFVAKRWPKYVELVLDAVITAGVEWKLGNITEKERNDIWDSNLISIKDRKMLCELLKTVG